MVRLFRKRTIAREVEIRRAAEDELDEIVALLAELVASQVPRKKRPQYIAAVREDQARRLRDRDTAWFVAHRGETLVGCARADIKSGHPLLAYLDESRYGYLFGVFVADETRHRGVGARLVAACEGWLKERGVKWVFLHSSPEAVGFYSAVGYDPSFEFARRL
ncbi:MAG TPA: GNAT family N-acetyltransferase [bacterium]|nr:GNAT family N-acetyltransferase [bacterium]